MVASVNEQAITFLLTVMGGCIIGLTYDCIRIFRRIIKHNNLVMNIEDLLYFILCGLFIFFILFNKNYGEIRAFSLFGSLLGGIIYFLSLSPIIVEYGTKIIGTLLKLLKTIILFILKPILLLLKIIFFPIRIIYRIFNKVFNNKLTKSKKWVKIKGRNLKRVLKVIFKKV